jgi:hypothetical protein
MPRRILVELDRNDRPGEPAGDAVRRMRHRRQAGIDRSEPPGAGNRTEGERDNVERTDAADDLRRRFLEAPAIEKARQHGCRRPREQVEQQMQGGIGRDVQIFLPEWPRPDSIAWTLFYRPAGSHFRGMP